MLSAELEARRPAHAYLLSGPDGLRLGAAAVQLAQALNCRSAEGRGACGECVACAEIARGVFPDFAMADEPTTKLAEVKAKLALLAQRPISGRRRVVVLSGAQQMTREAQNALLKTLEEPPGDSVLVLLASGLDGVLPTVLSRCRLIGVAGARRPEVAAALAAHDITEDLRCFAALAAGDDVERAQALADRDDLSELRSDAVNFVLGAIGSRRLPPLELVSRHDGRLSAGETTTAWFACLAATLRAVVATGAGDCALGVTAFERSQWVELEVLPLQDTARLAEVLATAGQAIASHAAARLALEAAMLSMIDEVPGKGV